MVASVETDGTPDPYGWLTDNRELAAAFGFPQILADVLGIKINVPPFIESGEKIVIDTRTLEYVKRVN